MLKIVLTGVAPGDQKPRRDVSRSRIAGSELCPCGRILPLLDGVDSRGETRKIVGRVSDQNAFGEHVGGLLVAGWWAVFRVLRRKTGWEKTARVAEAPARAVAIPAGGPDAL